MPANFKPSEFVCPHCGRGAAIVHPELLEALQRLRDEWGKPMVIVSGYRCVQHNKDVGGAPGSAHLVGMAADIADGDGALDAWLDDIKLAKLGLWREHPDSTPGWTHLSIRPSPTRTFWP